MPSENSKEISKIKEFLKLIKNTITGLFKTGKRPVVFFRIGVKMEDCF